MKLFEHDYPWTSVDAWNLPDEEEMMQGQFPILDEQIDAVLAAIEKAKGMTDANVHFRTCVQAGGAFGLYPIRLSYYFDKVVTFEPLSTNLECLRANIDQVDAVMSNLTVVPYPLWSVPDVRKVMTYSKVKRNSFGAHHIADRVSGHISEPVTTTTIDQQELEDVDLIWLDIEGAESAALAGAASTIAQNRPVVVVEERALPHMSSLKTRPAKAGTDLIKQHNYRFAGRTHGDVIYMPQ